MVGDGSREGPGAVVGSRVPLRIDQDPGSSRLGPDRQVTRSALYGLPDPESQTLHHRIVSGTNGREVD